MSVSFDAPPPMFREDVLQGLAHEQPSIPPRWFYDTEGSRLFEQITRLSEYYPTRTERAILEGCCAEVAHVVGPNTVVIEYGAGSAAKTPLLLDALRPKAYAPIDIAGDFLRAAIDPLRHRYPALPIHPIEADFARPLVLPSDLAGTRLGFFPGSTLGNLDPAAATALLRNMRTTLGVDSWLLIGLDLVKDPRVLVPAYNDAHGVTARFNKNMLVRINRELGGTIPVDDFEHEAVWNETHHRIEMRLRARRTICFGVGGVLFSLAKGRAIHTENSHKYDKDQIGGVLASGGWRVERLWTDPNDWFAVVLARRHVVPLSLRRSNAMR